MKLKEKRNHRPVPCPPLILEAVWTEHAMDTEGYSEFCDSYFGYFVSDKAVPKSGTLLRLQSILCVLNSYNESIVPCHEYALINIKHLVDNGMWWPELIPSHGPFVMPTTLPQEEKERGGKKRDRDEAAGEKQGAPATDNAENLSSESKIPALED
ncbi:hypothetical protein CYMTET_3925 [Cymbomonas tetramitiformis]|uniref:Uncharacterized protein n=1 Tax=Cymbomonas tetramitiformis TaxID=36881 RepID=A0AAE0H2E3_9CHLO|nr:hypothetical protein CYMTET_3925 [Cymbomonas tetramitiformis]